MKIEDYRLLILGALVRSTSLRAKYGFMLKEDWFDDTNQRFLASVLPKCENTTELVEATQPIGGLPYLKSFTKYVKRMGRVGEGDVRTWIRFLEGEEKKNTVATLIDMTKEEMESLKRGASVDKLISDLVTGLVGTYDTRTSKGFRSWEDVVEDVVAGFVSTGKGIVKNKTPTGFPALDDFLGGGLPNALTTIGGLPGMGKTQLMLEMEVNVAEALRDKVKRSKGKFNPGVVLFVSAEMSIDELLERAAQTRAGVEIKKNMPKEDVRTLSRWARRNASLPLMTDDSDILNTKLIYSRCEAMFAKYGCIRMIGMDFAELLCEDEDGGREGNREQQIGMVYIRSMILAKRYKCPVVLISHLNRTAEESKSKVPSMKHLRYSRMAEAMSDLVLLIYYPYWYIETGKSVATPTTMPASPGTSYIIVDKHRRGPTGVHAMGWQGNITRWSDRPTEGMFHQVDVLDLGFLDDG